jgi:hypothetical protein
MVEKKRQARITIEFEADESHHITLQETIDVAHSMFETLHKSCPGCSMTVLSMLVSMLAIAYIKDSKKEGSIFPHNEWIKDMTNSSMRAIDRYEHIDNPVN